MSESRFRRISCPKCGKHITVDSKAPEHQCVYCGYTFPLDETVPAGTDEQKQECTSMNDNPPQDKPSSTEREKTSDSRKKQDKRAKVLSVKYDGTGICFHSESGISEYIIELTVFPVQNYEKLLDGADPKSIDGEIYYLMLPDNDTRMELKISNKERMKVRVRTSVEPYQKEKEYPDYTFSDPVYSDSFYLMEPKKEEPEKKNNIIPVLLRTVVCLFLICLCVRFGFPLIRENGQFIKNYLESERSQDVSETAGEIVETEVSPGDAEQAEKKSLGISVDIDIVSLITISAVKEGGYAEKAGLQVGDKIFSIDGTVLVRSGVLLLSPELTLQKIKEIMNEHDDSTSYEIQISRNNVYMTVYVLLN